MVEGLASMLEALGVVRSTAKRVTGYISEQVILEPLFSITETEHTEVAGQVTFT